MGCCELHAETVRVKTLLLFVCVFLVVSVTRAHELSDCKRSLEVKIEQLEGGLFQRLLFLNPETHSWIKAGRAFLETFQMTEPYYSAPQSSPESFLYWNALQSCLDFQESFERQILKFQWITAGGVLLSTLILALVFFWRFR